MKQERRKAKSFDAVDKTTKEEEPLPRVFERITFISSICS